MLEPYTLVRSRRRTLALSVTADATLVVRAPMRTPLFYIEELIARKINWIRKAIVRMSRHPRRVVHKYIDGESFLYLGQSYTLSIVKDAHNKLAFKDGFILKTCEHRHARELFTDWYKREAKEKITERVARIARHTGLPYKSVRITSAKKRWGSCSSSGRLNFSWRLILAPLSVIDYVVAHELAHLTHKNHSRAFWNKVQAIYPNYAESKAWLRHHEAALTL